MKHGGSSIMHWGWGFFSAGTWALVKVEGIMNNLKYQSILAQNIWASAKKLKMKRNFTFQHDSDPKCTPKPTKELLHQNNIHVRARTQTWIPESLWGDLKMAVHMNCPRDLTDLERFCKEEWAKIPKTRSSVLVDSYPPKAPCCR